MSAVDGPTRRMRAGRVLLISIGLHAGLAALLSQMTLDGVQLPRDAQPPADPVYVEVVPPRATLPEPTPIEVAVLDEPAATPAPVPAAATMPSTSRPRATAHATRTELATSASSSAASTDSSRTERTTPTAPTTGYFKMRGPELGLSGETAGHIVDGGDAAHPLATEPKVSGKLQNTPGGGAVINDRVTTVTIERDGNAHFADKPDFDVHWKLPIPHLDIEGMRKDLGKRLTDWYADPYKGTRYGRWQDLPRHIAAVEGACDSWTDTMCEDPLAPDYEDHIADQRKRGGGSLLGGNASISDYLQRKLVGDPYASRKLKLLDDTRDERVARGTAFRAQQLVRSAELIERNLARLEAAHLPPADEREALFELWDECSEGEGAEAEAGARARAQVIGYIRAHFPKGSPGAFSDEDIASFDQRRTSHAHFVPYE